MWRQCDDGVCQVVPSVEDGLLAEVVEAVADIAALALAPAAAAAALVPAVLFLLAVVVGRVRHLDDEGTVSPLCYHASRRGVFP